MDSNSQLIKNCDGKYRHWLKYGSLLILNLPNHGTDINFCSLTGPPRGRRFIFSLLCLICAMVEVRLTCEMPGIPSTRDFQE
jgi:hypothetical protein